MTDRRYMYAEAVAILTAAEDEDDRGAPQACQAGCGYAAGDDGFCSDECEASVKDPDPFADPYWSKPWGEQQEQVDWLESRYDDQYEGEDSYYGSYDD